MHAQDIALIRSQFALIKGSEAAFSAAFYARLFELAPAVRAMFPGDMQEQSHKLMMTLAFAINTLDKPKVLRPVVMDLGARHVRYGAHADHFALVGLALLDTLAATLGDAYDWRSLDAWGEAYGTLNEMMRDGMEQAIGASTAA